MAGSRDKSGRQQSASVRGCEIEAAAEYGVDVAQLEANVKRSVAERIRRHRIALGAVEKLREAKKK